MKILRLLTIFSLILCFSFLLGSCDNSDALAPPENPQIEPTTLTLSWKKVNGARMYLIHIAPEEGDAWEVSASKNSYSLVNLDKGTYTIKIKAVSDETEKQDSAWSKEIPFVREAEPGFVMTLINNGTEYEVTNKGSATGDIVIPDTYRSKPVTSIAERAFFNKNDVTSVKLGANVKTIGNFAFGNCSYLTSIEFSDSLKTIGENAFASCRLLDGTLEFPNSLETISTSAFSYCASLTSLKFGSGLKTIGKSAFTDCTGLSTIELPDGLVTVGEYAFAACSALSSVDFGETVQTIGEYAFAKNTSLTKIALPDSVTVIGIGAFDSCSALSKVDLGKGLTSVDRTSFDGTAIKESATDNEFYVDGWFIALKDTSATYVNIVAGTYGIADYAFYANTNLSSVVLPDSVKIIGNCAFASMSINSVVIGSGVEMIGEKAFMACSNLSNVILGSYDFGTGKMVDSSLKSIGNYAFRNCVSLNEIDIPDSVEVIGTYAFNDSGLALYAESGVIYADNWAVGFTEELVGDVIIRSNTVGIANYAFYKCININSVEIPGSVKTIGRAAFYDCSELYYITLPDSLEVIEDYTFYGCHSLKLKTLPLMLKRIGRSAFYKCGTSYALDDEDTPNDTLVIPSGVKYIGDYAFYGCGQEAMLGVGEEYPSRGIDVIIIGDGVKTIGKNAFYGFVTLKKVVIGNGVTEIGEKAFYKCDMLEEVIFGESVENIGARAFYKCTALSNVTLPDSLRTIGDYAFYKCEGLSTLDLGNGVTTIGASAFYGCSGITTLSFPKSLVTIEKQAFRNCTGLTSVVLSSDIAAVMDHAFYGCSSLTIYTDLTETKSEWSGRWNSSYRPIVWGCNISEENDYVVSLNKTSNTVLNRNSINTISDPVREGYTFGGWGANSSTTSASYTSETLTEATNGRTFYAIWIENVE